MSRCSSARVLGGIGSPGVRKSSRRPAAFFTLGLKAADAQPDQRCFHSVDNPSLLSDEALALAVGPLGIFVLGIGSPPSCSDLARRAASRERRA